MRLDRLLLRKAEQGVKIIVLIYKEVTQSMTMSSAHTKHHLEDMHENISCIRHPDHRRSLRQSSASAFSLTRLLRFIAPVGGEMTMMWSHHSKIIVVDNAVATIGGLDLCFGRWSTVNAELADVHPTDFARSLYPGQVSWRVGLALNAAVLTCRACPPLPLPRSRTSTTLACKTFSMSTSGSRTSRVVSRRVACPGEQCDGPLGGRRAYSLRRPS